MKVEGDTRMSVKRRVPEDVYGAALQGPRDMAKAALLESQSPAVYAHPSLPRLWSDAADAALCIGSRVDLLVGGRWGTTPFKETNGTPTSRYNVQPHENAGLPTGRES